MTNLKGDLRSIMGTPFGGVGHAVLIFSRVTRAAFNSDSVVLQLHDRIEMPEEADGKFRIDGLDPGPVRVELEGGTVHNHGWNIDLPDEGTWSLADLVDAQVDWSPAVIGRAEAAARDSRVHADRAEAAADRVGTAEQVGTWASEASSSASAAASARSAAQTARNASQSARDAAEGHADRADSSASNAATSETNAKQSETSAGDYAAVATTAATEAVDAMERATDLAGGDFATHEYVDQKVASVTLMDTGSPEGRIAAPVGSVYTDSAATAGAIRWIKTSGTGSTGWKVEHGDTGWRDVTALNVSSSITFGAGAKILIRRINNDILFRMTGPATPTATRASLFQLLTGWRPDTDTWVALGGTGEQARHSTSWVSLETLTVGRDIISSGWSKEARWSGRDEWPSTLPGTPT